VRIVREVPEDLSLEFDAQRMQEVLLNLILNAVEAIGGRPGTITLAAGEDTEAGEAVISVADDGPGIPRDIQGQVFDPFFSTKTGSGPSGTGLGLAIVYGIVQKHRGRIEVESEPGQGTRFVIRLPMPESRDV
jgi:signal transduction histidine kinase